MFSKVVFYTCCFILATCPLLFGAVHPITQGIYIALILGVLGAWILFSPYAVTHVSKYSLSFIFLIFGILFFQITPLPLAWIETLSPVRYGWIKQIHLLAGGNERYATLSYSGIASLQEYALLLSLVVYFFTLKKILSIREGSLAIFIYIILIVGCFEALYGILQFIAPHLKILWLPISTRAAHGTIIYTNQYAALLNLCWPLALGMALYSWEKKKNQLIPIYLQKEKKRKKKKSVFSIHIWKNFPKEIIFFLFAAIIIMVAVLCSLSRGGILSMFFITICLYLFLPCSIKIKLLSFSFLIIIFTVLFFALDLDILWKRFGQIDQSGITRFKVYIDSLPISMEHAITGIGLGAYALISPLYLTNNLSVHFDHVHNEYLELLIELGFPLYCMLFLLLLSAFFFGIRRLYRLRRKIDNADHSTFIFASTLFYCLCGFFLHGLVDFGWRLPSNLFFSSTLFAMLIFCFNQKKRKRKSRPTRTVTSAIGA